MGTNVRQGIVTNGLILHLDAANRKSYVSGSTTWSDLSGNNRSGSLVNGPTFSTAEQGSIVFDGSNDYATFGTISNMPLGTQNRTMMGWIQDNSTVDYVGDLAPMFGYGQNNIAGQLFVFSIGGTTYNNRRFVIWTNTLNHVSTFSVDRNIWNHIAVTVTPAGVSFPRITIYKNGVSDGGSERNINTVNGPFEVAEQTSVPVLAINFNGKISQIQVYNRALSATEVAQNYNATKTRFGLS
jgi:hypothetical protein